MASKITRTVATAALTVLLLVALVGCETAPIATAARSGAASFINGIFNAAVNEAIVH
jgi:hypothetical protein